MVILNWLNANKTQIINAINVAYVTAMGQGWHAPLWVVAALAALATITQGHSINVQMAQKASLIK